MIAVDTRWILFRVICCIASTTHLFIYNIYMHSVLLFLQGDSTEYFFSRLTELSQSVSVKHEHAHIDSLGIVSGVDASLISIQ